MKIEYTQQKKMGILTRKIHSTHFFFSVYRIDLFSVLNFEKAFVRFAKSLCLIFLTQACDKSVAGLQFPT